MTGSKKTPFLLATCVLLATTTPAYAYLDPGTGSMILQGLIAASIGAMVGLKFYWHKVKSFFSGSKKSEKPDTDA